MNDTLIVFSLLIIIMKVAIAAALYLAVVLFVARLLSDAWHPKRKATDS